jgi:putative flavoprotein involved in K+ transport
VIVFATGYRSVRERIGKLLSEQVAERLGAVWGKDNQGEIPGTWRLFGQPGLWLMGGNL